MAQRKRACIKAPELLVPSTAAYFSQIEDISHYLSKLEFDEVPDYLLLRDLLESMEHQQMEGNVENESKHQQGYQLQTVSVPGGLETAVQIDNVPKEAMHEEENCTFKQEVNVEDVFKGSAAYEEKCYNNINQLVSILKMVRSPYIYQYCASVRDVTSSCCAGWILKKRSDGYRNLERCHSRRSYCHIL